MNPQMKKLFLLDAYALIYRAYYAFIKNPRVNSKGLNTSAIFGFVNTLEDVLKREKPTHIAVAFDPSGPTFRHEMYEQYKAHREETPEDIRKAVPIIKQIIEAYNIPVIQVAGFEADDVIGTLATKASHMGFEVYMMTPDKDYGQLVNEHCFMYKPKFGGNDFEVMGIEEVKKKFDLDNTMQVIDYLGLVGDASDNIPGCPGVGPVAATKLLKEFGSIGNLLKNTDKLKGALKDKIENNKDQIEFSRFLATIKIDVPVELEEDKLILENPDDEKLKALFVDLEFRNMLARFGSAPAPTQTKTTPSPKKQDSQQTSLFGDIDPETNEIEVKASAYSHLANASTTPHSYLAMDTKEKHAELMRNLMAQTSVCFDTETTGLDVFDIELVGMSFSWKKGEAFYVPFPANQIEAQAIVDEFKPFFKTENIQKIGQNMKYDILVLSNYGV